MDPFKLAAPNRHTILLVDGDPANLQTLRDSLDEPGIELTAVDSVADALERVRTAAPSLLLSELSLPDASGFALCRRLRSLEENSGLPIIIVSRWASETDRILAFECGADDFVAKPYFGRELASRVRAVLRRSRQLASEPPPPQDDRVDAFRVHSGTNEVWLGDRRIALTPKEFAILEALLQQRGRVLSRDDLIVRVWSHGPSPGERSVDAHVKSLRKKLYLAPSLIETIRGRGYRLSEKPVSAELLDRVRAAVEPTPRIRHSR